MRADYKDSRQGSKGSRNRRTGAKGSRSKSSRSASASRHQGRQLGWLWMVAGLAIGLFIAFLVHLKNQDESIAPAPAVVQAPVVQEPRKPVKTTPPKAATKETKPTQPTTPKEPEYRFYSLLKEQKVEVPDTQVRQERTKVLKKKPKSLALQVGSFRNASDADAMKAQMALLGFEANVLETESAKHGTWYRVRLGPYSDDRVLAKDRARLYSHKIESLKITLKEE